MTERCEPPEGLRGVDGWHWVQDVSGYNEPTLMRWQHEGIWLNVPPAQAASRPPHMYYLGYRYLAPVTPPATVAALVEALEGLCAHGENVVRNVHAGQVNIYHIGLGGLNERLDAARAALAAYRAANPPPLTPG